jgi:hypothetical protein
MLYVIREYLISGWEWLAAKAQFFAGETSEADISVDPGILLGLLILLTVCMLSAYWAASIAASRKHGILMHLALGAVAPIVYPSVILFTLDVHGIKEREEARLAAEAKAKAEEEEKARLDEMLGRTASQEGDGAEAGPVSYDCAYFKKIARNETGQLTGPWLISYKNQSVCALNISECLDEVLVVEIETPSGDRQRIRIRYSLIEGCEHA